MPNGSGYLKRVLVVDDETIDRQYICNALRKENYSFFATGTFPGAVNMLARHPGEIALLITDISLPERNGFELYDHLCKFEPDLKVLFVSGPTGAEVSKFYNNGFPTRHYLEKPFSGGGLITRVRSILKHERFAHTSAPS